MLQKDALCTVGRIGRTSTLWWNWPWVHINHQEETKLWLLSTRKLKRKWATTLHAQYALGTLKGNYPNILKFPLQHVSQTRVSSSSWYYTFPLDFGSVNINLLQLMTPPQVKRLNMQWHNWVHHYNGFLATMADHHNIDCPFMFSKLDIRNGFWILVINKKNAWNFWYVLPPIYGLTLDNLDDIQLLVPDSL